MAQLLSGAYRIEVFERDCCVFDSGEFSNLITDVALTHRRPFYSGYLCVGEGNQKPAYSDTELEQEITKTYAQFSDTGVVVTRMGKRYSRIQATATFTGINATVREVGYRHRDANSVCSRTLIQDANGLITDVPLVADQTLKITYFIDCLLPTILYDAVIQTPFEQVPLQIKTHDQIKRPVGVLAMNFQQPLANHYLRAILAGGGYAQSNNLQWKYDQITRTASALVRFNAVEVDRRFTQFSASSSVHDLPIFQLEKPLTVPANWDFSFTLAFSWGRA